jgi:hypothetical protein
MTASTHPLREEISRRRLASWRRFRLRADAALLMTALAVFLMHLVG